MRRKSVLAIAVVLTAFGCGGTPTAPSDSQSSPGTAGTLNLRITDSPYGSAKAVLVTFSEVTVHRNGNETKLPFPDSSATTWTCDLKKLQNGAQDLLASARPNAARYTMLKLVVQSAKIYFDNGAVSPTPCARSIPEPAGASFPLSIVVREVELNEAFTVSSDAARTILIDFDGEASIRETAPRTYAMNPVVRIVSMQ